MPYIEYESLEFENAYIYRKCSFPLANQGLVLVRGLNVDDGGYLGAGKSSIFEVFAQLQVGKGGKRDQRRGDHKSDMVNLFEGSDMSATLKFRLDGHPYEIRQYRKHHRFCNKVMVVDRQTGQNVLPLDVVRAPHKWIREQLLCVDETTFFNLIYLVQELNNVMIHGKEYERRNRFTVMFNLDIYDELRALSKRTLSLHETSMSDFAAVRDELREVKQKIFSMADLVDLEAELETAEVMLKHLQDENEQDTDEFTKMSTLHSELQQRTTGRRQIMSRFKGSALVAVFDHPKDVEQRNVDRWRLKYDNVSAEYFSAQADLDKLEKRDALRAQLRKFSDRDAEEIQDDLTETKTTLTYLNQVELPQAEERQSLLLKLQKLSEPASPLDELIVEQDEVKTKEVKLTRTVKDLDTEVRDAVCPHCMRPFDLSTAEVNKKRTELTQQREELQQITSRLHTLKNEINDAQEIKVIRSRMTATFETKRSPEEVSEDIRVLSGKERRLAVELETSHRRLEIEADLASMPSESKDTIVERCEKLRRSVEKYKDRSQTGQFIVDKLKELKDLPQGSMQEVESTLQELRGRLKRATSKITEASTDTVHLRESVNELRQLLRREQVLKRTLSKQEALLSEIRCLEALNQAFGTKGMKQDRLDAILSDAAERTVPAYADILWPNRNISLHLSDEEGSLRFNLGRSLVDVPTNSSLLSGGERHKAGLAFLFGLRDLKELYTGSSSNILIVDEPFGNLDPLGTEGLISIFALLKQKFGSVFVISHRPEVLSHPVWDQTWWAIRENNNAKLYLTDPPARYHQMASELVKQ